MNNPNDNSGFDAATPTTPATAPAPAAHCLMTDNTGTGTSVVKEETQKALEQLQEALQLIPKADRAALEQASETLVQTESNPVWFLRREHCNFWAAARRLVTYWTKRKEIFKDRAFLPLSDLSGNGLLDAQAVELLQSGIMVVLPKDAHGRSVVYFDRERNEDSTPRLLQVGFFLLSQMASCTMAQTEGFVVVGRVRHSRANGKMPSRPHFHVFADLVSTAFPVKMHSLHVTCCLPPKGPTSSTLAQTILVAVLQRLGAYFLTSAIVHVEDSQDKVCERLMVHGLTKQGVPTKLGGDWNYNAFSDWLVRYSAAYGDSKPAADVPFRSLDVFGAAAGIALHDDSVDVMSSLAGTKRSAEAIGELSQKRPALGKKLLGGFPVQETADMQHEGRLKLEVAMQTIPEQDRAAYMEAMRTVPDLVESESPPVRFLRAERYDPWAAARRLVAYWNSRKNIFGDRAFLPMDQTGQGALNEQDIEALGSGFIILLPIDEEKRAVLSIDHSRLPAASRENSAIKARCIFYMHALAAENEQSQRDGIVLVVVLEPKARSGSQNAFMRSCLDAIRDAWPVRMHRVHMVKLPTTPGTGTVLNNVTSVVLKVMGHLSSSWATVHQADSGQELVKKLKEHGLAKRGLPTWIGGTWDMDNFQNWQKRRERLEEDRILTEEEKLERKRKVNAVHSRQKRERRKIEKEVLKDQCAELSAKNAKVSKSIEELEELLVTAKNAVVLVERMEATKRENEAFVGQIRNVPSVATLQVQLGSTPMAMVEGPLLLRRPYDSLTVSNRQDLLREVVAGRSLAVERHLQAPMDPRLQIELGGGVYDQALLFNTVPSRIPRPIFAPEAHVDPIRTQLLYQLLARQQQRGSSFSDALQLASVLEPAIPPVAAAPVAPQLQPNPRDWGGLSSPFFGGGRGDQTGDGGRNR